MVERGWFMMGAPWLSFGAEGGGGSGSAKQNDAIEHRVVFDRVGLLGHWPPGGTPGCHLSCLPKNAVRIMAVQEQLLPALREQYQCRLGSQVREEIRFTD